MARHGVRVKSLYFVRHHANGRLSPHVGVGVDVQAIGSFSNLAHIALQAAIREPLAPWHLTGNAEESAHHVGIAGVAGVGVSHGVIAVQLSRAKVVGPRRLRNLIELRPLDLRASAQRIQLIQGLRAQEALFLHTLLVRVGVEVDPLQGGLRVGIILAAVECVLLVVVCLAARHDALIGKAVVHRRLVFVELRLKTRHHGVLSGRAGVDRRLGVGVAIPRSR